MATRTQLYRKLELHRRKIDLLMKQVENQNDAEDLMASRGVTLTPAQVVMLDNLLDTADAVTSWNTVKDEYLASKPTV